MHRKCLVILVPLAFAVSGCPGSDAKDCERGTDGCSCLTGDVQCRGEGLVCSAAGVCQLDPCPAGNESCRCLIDSTCNAASDAVLACDESRCIQVGCDVGEIGCTCAADLSCSQQDAICTNGRCMRKACSPGELNCPCDTGTCGPGLICQNQTICVDQAGYSGGPCHADGTCFQGNRCDHDLCVPCDIGARGCSCFSNNSCTGELACVFGLCVTEPGEALPMPSRPSCYTPCSSALVLTDGTVRSCSAEGLMLGCVGDQSCVEGSCVPPGGQPPRCKSDIDCPDFQACMRGGCYSNCEYDSDCGGALACYRHVCRLKCTTSGVACPDGQHCATLDGDNGYCMPLKDAEGEPQLEGAGKFTLDREGLNFSNINISDMLIITNVSDSYASFTVRKVQHVEYSDAGQVLVDTNPLSWLSMGSPGNVAQVQQLEVGIDAGAQAVLRFEGAQNPVLERWDGTLEIASPRLGKRAVLLNYTERPEGRWAGQLYFFSNFGDGGLDAWLAAGKPNSGPITQGVGNAFLQRWALFKAGQLDSFDELKAILTATLSGSWSWPSVKARCAGPAPNGACYLYDNVQGYGVYTDSLASYPVPTGIVQMPVAMNLRLDSQVADGSALVGRIESTQALQHAGLPGVKVVFANDATQCTNLGGACLVQMNDFQADIYVGARYRTTGACADGFEKARTPWLIPGFLDGTTSDPGSGLLYREECRDKYLPFGNVKDFYPMNVSFAGSNPIPDGNIRSRHIEIIDGLLINQDSMVIIFRETFHSFLGPDDVFSAYGVMSLKRGAANLAPSDFDGASLTHGELARTPRTMPTVTCDSDLVHRLMPAVNLSDANPSQVNQLATAFVTGISTSGPTPPIIGTGGNIESAHYLCVDTGLINAGPEIDNKLVACPGGSEVRYFTVTVAGADAVMRNLTCQRGYVAPSATDPAGERATCESVLDAWVQSGTYGIRMDPRWSCTDPTQVFCSANRYDLREGKQFYQATIATDPANAAFINIEAATDEAFRYKTRFRSRSGSGVGFAPTICVPNSEAVPYCYDPPAIEEIADRTDCLLDIYYNYYDDLKTNPSTLDLVNAYLKKNFASQRQINPVDGTPIATDGFERLNVELLIMMGDEAYTSAFASRFDLAGSKTFGFEGALFEPNGINLSGGAGFEMYSLYEAAQYYQVALDRFYSIAPIIGDAIHNSTKVSFVTSETVSSYFERLIRASTQKARAWSEIAKRYQGFNRPDLARLVVERAYTATYLESVVLSRIMLSVIEVIAAEDRPFVAKKVELAALGYRSAMLDMGDVYRAISDNVTFFGFQPDYIPFPAMDTGDINAFEKLLASTRQKMAVAADKEKTALATSRSFETDMASFQSELTRIENTYEAQLADLCGTFVANGNVYPAIPKYAYLDPFAAKLENPCGFMGNGQVYDAAGALEVDYLQAKSVATSIGNVLEEASIEEQRIDELCDTIKSFADIVYAAEGRINTAQDKIRKAQDNLAQYNRNMQLVGTLTSYLKCNVGMATDCITGGIAATVYTGAWLIAEHNIDEQEKKISDRQKDIEKERQDLARLQINQQCDTAKVDAKARVASILLRLSELDIEALKAQYRISLDLANIQALRQKGQRLIAEQDESAQLTINIEAARNDPNVRIYKNDAILNADRTFQEAIREAYKATKVFEYYTSQSYARLGDLFLIRMISSGDISLESYVSNLESAFVEFEEHFGNPDVRVAIVSLKDDVMGIPRLDTSGVAMSDAARTSEFRARLADVTLLDGHGYITIPFATSLGLLSPLTSNHKIMYLEAELIGSDVGDTLGRVYVRQKGTGAVRTVEGGKLFYAFPERSAVLNPFFNGMRVFTPEVYRNNRFRDRPFVNTQWEMVVNQKDEHVNQDVNLQSLTDVRLYVYYTDFTAF